MFLPGAANNSFLGAMENTSIDVLTPDSTAASTKKFTMYERIVIGCTLNSGLVPARNIAIHYQCDVSYVYRLGRLADQFLAVYTSDESINGIIPLTKQFLDVTVVCLRVVCQASEEDTVRFIRMVYQQQISVSTVSNICKTYGDIALKWNSKVSLNNISIGANDEIFFGRAQRQMILAGVDLKSTYVYGMVISPDRKAETWQLFMMCLKDQGLDLDVSISDAGASLIRGISDSFENCFCQLDVFHSLKDLGEPFIQLERKAYSLLDEMFIKEATLKGPKPHKSTRIRFEELSQNMNAILNMVDTLQILYSWVHELLDFTGYSHYETQDLLLWIVHEMHATLDQYRCLNGLINTGRVRHAINIFEGRIPKSLSFIDYAYRLVEQLSKTLGVDPAAAHMMYRLCAFSPFSEEYAHMKRRIDSLLRCTEMTFEMLEKEVQTVIASAQKASSMIENVNSRLRTALNDSRGMTPLYLALLMLFINTKEYRRSMISERIGKSPYELLTGKKVSFMDILFPDFHPVLPVWSMLKKAA